MNRTLRALALLLCLLPLGAEAYEVRYRARILPDRGMARLSVAIVQSSDEVREISFAVEPDRFFDESADGALRVEDVPGDDGEPATRQLVWEPPAGGGTLRYSMRVDRVREGSEYDARCASSWMLLRAEDLFPPMSARYLKSADLTRATLSFKLPPRWKIAHPFEIREGVAIVDQPHRRFDQPKGWIVAGLLSRVAADIEGTRVVLAAPRSHDARLQDTLAFLRWTLPEAKQAFGTLPPRILVTLAGDPMWRGGLSAPASVYLHADRPLIDKDSSSPLLHELVHTVTRARSAPGEDWIVEGVAEHYSRELLRRSGAISQADYDDTLARLRRRGGQVRRLEGEASGAETALGVALFHDLDERIREGSEQRHSLDDVVATMVGETTAIDREELARRVLDATGVDARRLVEARIPEVASAE